MAYPTEEELAHQRRVIRQTYPRLFEAVEQQLHAADKYLPTIPRKEATKYDLALNAHLARATKTTMAIVSLCEHGYGEAAMSTLRSLGETMVSAYYLSLDQEAHADQFEAFARHEQVSIYDLFVRLGWEDSVSELAELYTDPELRDAVKAQFPNPAQGWMQLPMKDVVSQIERCWNDPRELRTVAQLLHLLGDQHSHVGTIDSLMLLRADEKGIALHLGPGKKWVREALSLTAWVYGQVFDLWAEHFQMPELEAWRQRWRVLNARTHALSTEQVKGVGRNDPCPCGSGVKFKRCHGELMK